MNTDVIISAAEKQCLLNTSFRVAPGGKFSVMAGKKLIIPGVLNVK